MKRVLIFSLNYYPHFIGGAEVAIKEITDRIPEDEIEFHMITLRLDQALPFEERIGNVVVYRIGPTIAHPTIADLKRFPLHYVKHLYQILAVWKALRLHRRYRYDGIWAMMAHSCGIPAALFKTWNPEIPYLLTLQEGDPPQHIERLAKPVWPLFVASFTKADYLQPISTFLKSWGARMGFKGQAEVIPNGVSIAHFAAPVSESRIEEMSRSMGKAKDEVALVTTSRLVHKNGVDDVIRALPLLPKNITFYIYGIGPDENTLRNLARTLDVAERVKFMGQLGHADMPVVLRACDIFIRPSRSEGMGNSFIEAMAAGVPVIATQEGGIADFLFDSARNPGRMPTGWAVDANAPEQIVSAVTTILAHPERVAEVRQHAVDMVRERYDWDKIAISMRGLFARMLVVR